MAARKKQCTRVVNCAPLRQRSSKRGQDPVITVVIISLAHAARPRPVIPRALLGATLKIAKTPLLFDRGKDRKTDRAAASARGRGTGDPFVRPR